MPVTKRGCLQYTGFRVKTWVAVCVSEFWHPPLLFGVFFLNIEARPWRFEKRRRIHKCAEKRKNVLLLLLLLHFDKVAKLKPGMTASGRGVSRVSERVCVFTSVSAATP